MKKIDIHVHGVLWKGISFYKSQATLPTPDEIIAIYERLGIEKGVLMPLADNECQSRNVSNEEIMEVARRYPDSFYWYCSIHPRMGRNSPETDLSYFLEYYREHGARGVGEFTANMYFDDPFVENTLYHCQKCRMPILFHTSTQVGNGYGLIDDCGLPRLEKALVKYPQQIFIGHAPPFWSHISGDLQPELWADWYYPKGRVIPGRLSELLRKYPNLYGDISACSGKTALMRDAEFSYGFLEEFQDQLLFGTDICDARYGEDTDTTLSAWVDSALENGKISEKAYRKICRENALRLLNGDF